MKIQSPINIEVLLHYHISPLVHPRADAPAVGEAIAMLLKAGCLETVGPGLYHATPKGVAWVRALCNVEEPREAFVDAQGNILG
jgi:hypothetical protein